MFHTKNKVINFWYHECQTKNVFSGYRRVEGNSEDPAVRTAMMFEFCFPLFGDKKLHSLQCYPLCCEAGKSHMIHFKFQIYQVDSKYNF